MKRHLFVNPDLLRAAAAASKLQLRYDLQEDSITVFFTPVRVEDPEIDAGPLFTPYLLSGDARSWLVGADAGGDGPETQSATALTVPGVFKAIRGMIEHTHMPQSVMLEIQKYLVNVYLRKL